MVWPYLEFLVSTTQGGHCKMQKRAIKVIIELKHFPYAVSLWCLGHFFNLGGNGEREIYLSLLFVSFSNAAVAQL